MAIYRCDICGRRLETEDEKDAGICEDCEEEDGMNNLASAILNTDSIEPNAEDL